MTIRTTSLLLLIATLAMLTTGCFKKKSTVPQYTAKMGDTRHWHGMNHIDYFGPGSGGQFSTYQFSDSLLTLTVIDENKVFFVGDTLSYSSTDTVHKLYFFKAPNGDFLEYGYSLNGMSFVHAAVIANMNIYNSYSSD